MTIKKVNGTFFLTEGHKVREFASLSLALEWAWRCRR